MGDAVQTMASIVRRMTEWGGDLELAPEAGPRSRACRLSNVLLQVLQYAQEVHRIGSEQLPALQPCRQLPLAASGGSPPSLQGICMCSPMNSNL